MQNGKDSINLKNGICGISRYRSGYFPISQKIQLTYQLVPFTVDIDDLDGGIILQVFT
jgi:hypothetical protein